MGLNGLYFECCDVRCAGELIVCLADIEDTQAKKKRRQLYKQRQIQRQKQGINKESGLVCCKKIFVKLLSLCLIKQSNVVLFLVLILCLVLVVMIPSLLYLYIFYIYILYQGGHCPSIGSRYSTYFSHPDGRRGYDTEWSAPGFSIWSTEYGAQSTLAPIQFSSTQFTPII